MAISNISGFALLDEIVTSLHPTSGSKTIGALTITFPIKIRLMTANGNSTTAGTELTSGGSYVAGTGLTTGANWAATSGGSQATNAIISQTNMPAATIVGIELWDSNGTPKRTEWGSITSKTTVAGDTLSFASGAITSAIA